MDQKEKKTIRKITPLSRLKPKGSDAIIDSLKRAEAEHRGRETRNMEILVQAKRYWHALERFRQDRDRNKRYNYGRQWDDVITVDGKRMREEDYIREQGNVPLKNNLIRRLVRNVMGVYRSQFKEPTCVARDRDEQAIGETMSTVLQCNWQLNRMSEVNARTFEEFLISGFIVQKKTFGWRRDKYDCWTDYVQPNNFFIDNGMRDFRGWDVSFLGEIHDISFDEVCREFAHSPSDYYALQEEYRIASDRRLLGEWIEQFGENRLSHLDFLVASPGKCRVIEIWNKETKPRYRCHDYQNGEFFKIDAEDYPRLVKAVNDERTELGLSQGVPLEEIPLISAEWFVDDYWYFRYLTPTGRVLQEGETPYKHGSHPYVFKAYPFIDGEIHSFVSDVVDQQRYVNRLVTMQDFIMRASAKGVLMIPDTALNGKSPDEFADEWSRFNGVIVYTPKPGIPPPTQISSNSTNVGINELLNIQLKFFEDISGVNGALQGKPGFSGTSGALFAQQTQNATTSLLDILETFSYFIIDGAYKDVKNIQQFYDKRTITNIVGTRNTYHTYDPEKVQNVEFDLSIVESTSTPAFRQTANEFLLHIWGAGQITLEQLLEHGDFPFADQLIQSIQSQKEAMQAQGQEQVAPPQEGGEAIPQEIVEQVQAQSNPDALSMLEQAIRGREDEGGASDFSRFLR